MNTATCALIATAAPVSMLGAPGPMEEAQAKVARRLRCLA